MKLYLLFFALTLYSSNLYSTNTYSLNTSPSRFESGSYNLYGSAQWDKLEYFVGIGNSKYIYRTYETDLNLIAGGVGWFFDRKSDFSFYISNEILKEYGPIAKSSSSLNIDQFSFSQIFGWRGINKSMYIRGGVGYRYTNIVTKKPNNKFSKYFEKPKLKPAVEAKFGIYLM